MNAGGDQAGDIGKSIAALTSKRTNLSPFTKGCRDRGASMRIIYNFFRGSAPTCYEHVAGYAVIGQQLDV